MRKVDKSRPYAPDFVDAQTLAYRLCCSERLLADYVAAGVLPKPLKIGNLVRWHWQDIVSQIETLNGINDKADMGNQDACAAAIEKAREARKKGNARPA